MGWWSFDDSQTQRYIDQAMRENARYLNEQTHNAWNWLYNLRGRIDPKDDNRELAAAEHYMYARWQVGSGETYAEVMAFLVAGYDPSKLVGYLPGVYQYRQWK